MGLKDDVKLIEKQKRIHKMAKKWEYKILKAKGKVEGLEEELNTLGEEGWELVQVVDMHIGVHVYMRRRTK